MKCPKCNKPGLGRSARLLPQSLVDSGMEQQRRTRHCFGCGFTWDTVELSWAEMVRLRVLAHRATMPKEAA